MAKCRFCPQPAHHALNNMQLCCEHYTEAIDHGADLHIDLTAGAWKGLRNQKNTLDDNPDSANLTRRGSNG